MFQGVDHSVSSSIIAGHIEGDLGWRMRFNMDDKVANLLTKFRIFIIVPLVYL